MCPGAVCAAPARHESNNKVELTRGIAKMKKLGWIVPAAFLLAAATYSPPANAYQHVCPNPTKGVAKIAHALRVDTTTVRRIIARECANVGRSAYNALGPDWLRSIYLGPIRRVVWVDAGDIITMNNGVARVSIYSGFMYVIGPGGVARKNFFRWGNDVAPVIEYAQETIYQPRIR